MKRVLFLGSSHVGAFKNAFDRLGSAAPFEARFLAANAADITFTEVVDGSIAPSSSSTLTPEALDFFLPGTDQSFRYIYFEKRRPLFSIHKAFAQTAKSAEVSLEGIDAIVYLAGTSPYDFVRLGEMAAPLAASLRAVLMERLIGAQYALRPQIEAIRGVRPQTRHIFVGLPLSYHKIRKRTPAELDVLAYKRTRIAELASRYLFDDVFMPDESVLQPNLMATRSEFFPDGRHETSDFLGVPPTRSDNRHVNANYGAEVIAKFLTPRLT